MEEKSVTKKRSAVKQISVSKDTAVASSVGSAFQIHEKTAKELVSKCEKITQVDDDSQNEKAREIAKTATELKTTINNSRTTMNKPLNERVKKNNNDAKQLIEPLDSQIERLRGLIGSYEEEKERIRQEELRKAEEERLAKQREEEERQRAIQEIRNKINNIQNDYNRKIHECRTSKTLDKYEVEIKAIKVTKNEFGEQVDSMKHVKEILLEQIVDRYEIVKQLEKADAEEKERLLAEEKEKEAAKVQAHSLEEQNLEATAEQEILVLLSSIHTKDCGWSVDDKLVELKNKYGSAREAAMYRDDIIANEQAHLEQNQSIQELKDDKVKNLRKEIKFKVIDETKIPREYLKVDEAKIKAALGENRAALKEDIDSFSIDGVEFYIERTTVLK